MIANLIISTFCPHPAESNPGRCVLPGRILPRTPTNWNVPQNYARKSSTAHVRPPAQRTNFNPISNISASHVCPFHRTHEIPSTWWGTAHWFCWRQVGCHLATFLPSFLPASPVTSRVFDRGCVCASGKRPPCRVIAYSRAVSSFWVVAHISYISPTIIKRW